MTTVEPCVSYEQKLETAELVIVKLEYENAQEVVRTRKVPEFNTADGVEGLFFVIDALEKAAERMQFPVGQYRGQFTVL